MRMEVRDFSAAKVTEIENFLNSYYGYIHLAHSFGRLLPAGRGTLTTGIMMLT